MPLKDGELKMAGRAPASTGRVALAAGRSLGKTGAGRAERPVPSQGRNLAGLCPTNLRFHFQVRSLFGHLNLSDVPLDSRLTSRRRQ